MENSIFHIERHSEQAVSTKPLVEYMKLDPHGYDPDWIDRPEQSTCFTFKEASLFCIAARLAGDDHFYIREAK